MKNGEYISLKEAAKMSGYSPDYVGQLIRSGKIQGKQVFSNVAWVTTEEAILEYIHTEKKKESIGLHTSVTFQDELFSIETLGRFYAAITWFVVAFLIVCILAITYVFSVSIDHRIDQKYLEQARYEK